MLRICVEFLKRKRKSRQYKDKETLTIAAKQAFLGFLQHEVLISPISWKLKETEIAPLKGEKHETAPRVEIIGHCLQSR